MTTPSFNWETAVSSFDRTGTLLKQLKSMEDAFKNAGLENCEVVDETASSLKLKFTFADGSSLTTSAIDIKGAKGDAATVAVGTTTTLPAGSSASVTNSGSSSAAVFNFSIPKGDKGDTGDPGGVTTFGGQDGAITVGDGLIMSGKELNSYDFNLSTTGTKSTWTNSGVFSNLAGNFSYAFNADKSIGKLYGRISADISGITESGYQMYDTGITIDPPDNAFWLNTGSIACDTAMTLYGDSILRVDASGHILFGWYGSTSFNSKRISFFLPACIYFFKDFGDPGNRMMRTMGDILPEPEETPSER